MSAEALKAFSQRLKAFAEGSDKTAEDIVNRNSDAIADLQAQQLAQGIKSTGENITPPYSVYTIEEKKKKSGLAGEYRYVTWFDTGETYRKLKAIASSGKYVITAPTYKLPLLEKKYGNKVLGLTKENAEEFRDSFALPAMRAEFTRSVLA